MGTLTRLASMFERADIDKVIEKKVEAKLKEAGNSANSEEMEDRNWRQITARGVKAHNPMEQYKMQKICYYLFDKNGIAKKAIERAKDFVLGDGATYSTPDEAVKKVLDVHWNSPQNLWEYKQDKRLMELGIYGEQFYPAFVNNVSGAVNLGYVDPILVDKVITDPENIEKRIAYTVTYTGTIKPKPYKIINLDDDPKSPTFDYLVGDSFFFEINNVTNHPRGRSDLFTAADAIDAYEYFLFNRTERADILNRIIYDVTWQNLSDKEIKERAKTWKIPRANEANHHNQNMSWKIVSPELGSQDATGEARLIFNHAMACLGYPPTWFASGEGLTKGTAGLMDAPTKKQLRARQKVFRFMLSYIFRYVIHQAIIHKTLTKDKKDVPVQIHLPKIEEKEIETITTSLANLTNSLVVAVDGELITLEQAQKIYALVLAQFGRETESIKKESVKEGTVDNKTKKLYQTANLASQKKPDGEED